MYPRKLYVETTTRCNMQCGMCVKHAPGSSISNADLDFELYLRLTTVFPHLEALVLNGIGEPILHPELISMIELAKSWMPDKSWIGFQTNGLLLNTGITEKLLAAGLNRLCISVDSSTAKYPGSNTLTHPANQQQSPVALVRDVCNSHGCNNFKLGAEIVLVKETLPQLPGLITQLAEEGVDFIIGSHLLAYQQDAESQSVFNSGTAEAWKIFSRWQAIARDEGINLSDLTARTWIAPHRDEEHRLQQIYKEMLADASQQSVWLNVKKIVEWHSPAMERHAEYMREATSIAARYGIEISLPPLAASTTRKCRFLEDEAVFIDVDGFVMPCHPLWHTHTVYMDQEAKHLQRRTFGSIGNQDILAIWQSPEYREFRQSVLKYDYPFCHSCSLGPCPDITGETTPFVNDCFGTTVPCGHCLWCFDSVRCL